MNSLNDQKQIKNKFKLAIIGDNNVGKSTLISAYITSSADKNVIQSKNVNIIIK